MKTLNRKVWMALAAAAALAIALPSAVFAEDAITGTVSEVQKYGNLTMDIKPQALYDAGLALGDVLAVRVGEHTLTIPFCTSYSDVDTGSLVVRDDRKNGLLIVAINMGNFSTKYGAKAGDQVSFSLLEKGGYLSEYTMRQLKRTNARSDYATDSVFANFRSVAVTGIKAGILYRSSNPINNELGRAAYADNLAAAVGIKTVINLSDSETDIAGYFAAPGFDSPFYKGLYDAGQVKPLNMGVDLTAPEFGEKFAQGIRFLIAGDGPTLIHCTEGKDRAGFVSAVLESLMGASIQEVRADYMASYENYYGVKRGSEQYDAIASSNIETSIATVLCGMPKGTDLSAVALAPYAEDYLRRIGLKDAEIAALRAKLSATPSFATPTKAGIVTQVEKYGHTLTDITIDAFNDLGFRFGDMVTAVFDNGFVLEAPYLDGYYVNAGDPLVRAYPGQTNVAVCVNYGKLNVIAQVASGNTVTLFRSKPGAYLTQYEIRKLVRSNKREDYASDEIFANFRSIQVGSIAKGALYRSSSPIDNQLGRAAYADTLVKNAGIVTVANLSDSDANVRTYMEAAGFASPYYGELYKRGQVMLLNMNLAYGSEEFRANVAKAVAFMADHRGPYLFHCTEGKDRTGFVAALLEALMGASVDEIVADYMVSYANYYGVKAGTEQYRLISEDVIGMLKVIAGGTDISQPTLASGARAYLSAGGMGTAQIDTFMRSLSVAQ